MRIILHIDFNSYFATVEQQANPRLRGKPIGVTGGDRMKRTVIGAASVEAKKFGIKTGMQIWEAKKLCPKIILVKGDSDKYLECTKKFLNILKDYSPYLEVFSIDEVFLEIPNQAGPASSQPLNLPTRLTSLGPHSGAPRSLSPAFTTPLATPQISLDSRLLTLATDIKRRIKAEVGEWITCSIGISYNKLMAKFAGSLQKPDGLVGIFDQESAQMILDQVELDEVWGIGGRIKQRLNNMGIFSFKDLRKVPLGNLLASFKSYGQILYNISRGIDNSPVIPFYEKQEIKSVGHRHTINYDTDNTVAIKQILLKLTELIARRLRAKKLVGKTVYCYFRKAFRPQGVKLTHARGVFEGNGMQVTIPYTADGLKIFEAAWRIFKTIWDGEEIRMVGVSISNLQRETPQNLSLLDDFNKQQKIIKALDKINNRYGEFTLQRAILLGSTKVLRKPNPYLADRRFKLF